MGSLLNHAIFMPPQEGIDPEFKSNCLTLKSSKGTEVLARLIMNPNSSKFIIFSHANAENIEDSFNWCIRYLASKIEASIIVYEYTGYDVKSESKEPVTSNGDYSLFRLVNVYSDYSPSEYNVYSDIETVYDYLVSVRKVVPTDIIAFGRSLGSGPSCYLAEKHSIGGLILSSAFTSILRIVFNFRISLMFDVFSNIDRIKNIECPVLVIHSLNDEIVPFDHALEIFDACKNPFEPLFISGTDHNNIDRICSQFFKHIQAFVKFIYEKNR